MGSPAINIYLPVKIVNNSNFNANLAKTDPNLLITGLTTTTLKPHQTIDLYFVVTAITPDVQITIFGGSDLRNFSQITATGPINFPAYTPTMIYVSTNGNDTYNGQEISPLLTIQAALALISDASESKPYVIKVSAGVFSGGGFAIKPWVSIDGAGQDATILFDGYNLAAAWNNPDLYATISNMTLTGSSSTFSCGGTQEDSKLTFKNCYIDIGSYIGVENSPIIEFIGCTIITGISSSSANLSLLNTIAGNVALYVEEAGSYTLNIQNSKINLLDAQASIGTLNVIVRKTNFSSISLTGSTLFYDTDSYSYMNISTSGGPNIIIDPHRGSYALSSSPPLLSQEMFPSLDGELLKFTWKDASDVEHSVLLPQDTVGATPISFSAVQSSPQAISSGLLTKITFNSAEFNNGGYFDPTTNYDWMPPAGVVLISVSFAITAPSVATDLQLYIVKKGVIISKHEVSIPIGEFETPVISRIEECDGTDYFEVWAIITAIGGSTVNNDPLVTYFQGSVLIDKQYNTDTIVEVSGTSKTFGLSDINTIQNCINGSSVSLTVPLNSSVAFPIGTSIQVIQSGLGQVLTFATGGVTLQSEVGANPKIAVQYARLVFTKIATDTWNVAGRLTA